MIHFQRSRTIDATPQAIWAILEDFMGIDRFAPRIAEVEALSEVRSGPGARRRCTFADGNSVVEQVARWEPGRGYRVELLDLGAMPLKRAQAAITIRAVGPERSEVVWSFDFAPKFGPLGWLLGQTMLKAMMKGVLDENLAGLDEAAAPDPARAVPVGA